MDDVEKSILKKTKVITDHEECAKIVDEILQSTNPLIGFDCEGLCLGTNGVITLAQIGLPDGRAFIFDVMLGPRLFTLGKLQDLLESDKVKKVMHDCRGDSANLNQQFDVVLHNVFDTQAACTVIRLQETGTLIRKIKNLSLQEICKKYECPYSVKSKDKTIYINDRQFWEQRPLTESMIAYAALDVLCLVPEVYESMLRKVHPELRPLLQDLCQEQVLMNMKPAIKKFRAKLRIVYRAELEEIERKIISAAEKKKKTELSLFEIGLLRYNDLPQEIRDNIGKYYKSPKLLKATDGEDIGSSSSSNEENSFEIVNSPSDVTCELNDISKSMGTLHLLNSEN